MPRPSPGAAIGLALWQLGRAAEARKHLEYVVIQRPDDANAHVNLGIVLQASGDPAAARVQFESALKINPRDADARARLDGLSGKNGP